MTYLRKTKQQNLTTSFTANTSSQTISTSVVDITNSEVTFTPPAGNFQFVVYEYTVQYEKTPDENTHFHVELREKIGSGSYNFVDGVDISAGVPYNIGYNYSGDQYAPMTSTHEVDITSTSAYTFAPHYRGGASSSAVWCHIRAGYSLLVMEIAG